MVEDTTSFPQLPPTVSEEPAVDATESSNTAPTESSTEPKDSTAGQATGSTAALMGTSEPQVKVYSPYESTTPKNEDFEETYFEPTLADVRSHHASIITRNKRLNEAPLLTAKYRDAEKEEREKAKKDKWPETTIRLKFSDGTIIQSVFPSSSPIQPVYAFVRSCLDEQMQTKPFVLWQPPKTTYPEHPLPPSSTTAKKPKPNPYKTNIIAPANYGNVRGGLVQGLQGGSGGEESLGELGLVPQSILMVRWDDADMNSSSVSAPLKPELKQKSEPLPPSAPKEQPDQPAGSSRPGAPSNKGSGEKKVPKWLQKGLLKKKT